MKKFITKLTILALVAFSSFPVTVSAFWATVNWTAAEVSTWVGYQAGSWLTVTAAWYDFSTWTWELSSWSLQMLDSDWTSTWWTLTVTASWSATLTFTHATEISATWAYMISFRSVWADTTADTSDDVLVTAMLYLWSANEVTVTAIVEPILTMTLDWTSVWFWVLDPTQAISSSNTTTWTIATNAWWYTVLVAASATWGVAWWLYSTSADSLIAWSWSTAAWSEAFDIQVSTWAVSWKLWDSIMTINNFASSDTSTVLSSTAQNLVSWDDSTSWDIFVVQYDASISTITAAASDYETTVTYTVTWTF